MALAALCTSVLTLCLSSMASGVTSVPAAVGVAARRSAARSVMVKSVSCPTADTTGVLQAATALTTSSSLKAHRSSSEPPPLVTTITSLAPAVLSAILIALTISGTASAPCTGVGTTVISAPPHLALAVRIKSLTAAPAGEVTRNILSGKPGRVFLSSPANSPSFSSFSLSSSSLAKSRPLPACSMPSTTSCRSPRPV